MDIWIHTELQVHRVRVLLKQQIITEVEPTYTRSVYSLSASSDYDVFIIVIIT